jgi:hypothetical protein
MVEIKIIGLWPLLTYSVNPHSSDPERGDCSCPNVTIAALQMPVCCSWRGRRLAVVSYSLNCFPGCGIVKLIQDLEAELRVKLLQRTTRIVAVTPAGAAYYDQTMPLMQALDEINRSFGVENASPSGKIRIDISASLASRPAKKP